MTGTRPGSRGGSCSRPVRDERGAGSTLILAVALVAACAAWAVVIIGTYIVAAHTAAGAADLAAVDAARAVETGDADGCHAATVTAEHNNAEIIDCTVSADGVEFVVSVEVQVSIDVAVPGLPKTLTAHAEAGRVEQDQTGESD